MTDEPTPPTFLDAKVINGRKMVSFAFIRMEAGTPDIEAHAFYLPHLEAMVAKAQAAFAAEGGAQ